jgi:hypothetical protein
MADFQRENWAMLSASSEAILFSKKQIIKVLEWGHVCVDF